MPQAIMQIIEKASQMFAPDQEDWKCFSNKKVKVVKPFTAVRNTRKSQAFPEGTICC